MAVAEPEGETVTVTVAVIVDVAVVVGVRDGVAVGDGVHPVSVGCVPETTAFAPATASCQPVTTAPEKRTLTHAAARIPVVHSVVVQLPWRHVHCAVVRFAWL